MRCKQDRETEQQNLSNRSIHRRVSEDTKAAAAEVELSHRCAFAREESLPWQK
eukprot:SAG31_NODE_730_length_12505_cov_3.807109_12_plen_53_part_00